MPKLHYPNNSNLFWQTLFCAGIAKHRNLLNVEIARKLNIPSAYIASYASGETNINFQTRLWCLDMNEIQWNYHLMLYALGDEYAIPIDDYFKRSKDLNYYYLKGRYTTAPKFWRQLANFLMQENQIKAQAHLAEEISTQAPTFCAFLYGKTDIRLDRKIHLLDKAMLSPDIFVLDAMLPSKFVDSFPTTSLYNRFLISITENRDIGPMRQLVQGRRKKTKLATKQQS